MSALEFKHPAGGCPRCGRSTTLVDLEDFGATRGQLCPVHGVVQADD